MASVPTTWTPDRPAARAAVRPTPNDVRRWPLRGLYGASLAIWLTLLWLGWSYYTTPAAERPFHEGYWRFKPGGSIGIALGITGSVMMLLMHLYSVRKRVKLLRKWSMLSRWLDLHIYFGIVGPLCIVLHSSFKVGGLVSLSFWSMVAVALSGILGRYLYLQIPRTRAGEELTLKEIQILDGSLTERLRTTYRLDEQQLERLAACSGSGGRRLGLAGVLATLWAELSLRRRLLHFVRECSAVPRPLLEEFQRVAREKARLQSRIRLWNELHSLFFYWHVVHKPFAVIMYVFMFLHIAIALYTGYGWSGR